MIRPIKVEPGLFTSRLRQNINLKYLLLRYFIVKIQSKIARS